MKHLSALALLAALAACDFNPDAKAPIESARMLTRNYTLHELTAYAAGTDCRVLLVRTRTALDDATVETLHYGDGESATYPGGLQQYAEERKFRAVAYRDQDGGLWTYGSITRQEAQTMPVCR
ncbi:MAG TPA: hypothetical protein VF432_22910 [Thermoanaerobaculia bacterium]